jgi:hypothetical protein
MVNVVVVDMAVAADDEGDIEERHTRDHLLPKRFTDHRQQIFFRSSWRSVLTPSLVFVFGRMRIVGLNDF